MSLVEKVETLLQQPASSYEDTRFNALRHGVLSQYTVLPWENSVEYHALIEALVVEHKPQGPTEEHLVEELAGIVWRKRRLRLAEGAAHHRALMRATEPHGDTAKAALIHIAAHDGKEDLGEAIRATEPQTAEELADIEADRAMTEEALRHLAKPSSSTYSRALGALREDTRELWEDQLNCDPDDYDEDQTPYRADAESLKRFLETEVSAAENWIIGR
jgi:hypothetical protein